jgi:hypothetical protein
MDLLRDTIMIIGIPPGYHDTLSRRASERNRKNPGNKVTEETLVVGAICEYIDRMEQIEANLKPTDENAAAALTVPDCDSVISLQFKGSLSSPENSQE